MNTDKNEFDMFARSAARWLEQSTNNLIAAFPVGSRVEVTLRSGQKTPTPATVIGHRVSGSYTGRSTGGSYGGVYGYVNVEIDSAKPYSRQRVRSIHHTNVKVTP